MEETVVGSKVTATVQLYSRPHLTHIQLVHAAENTQPMVPLTDIDT